MTSDLIVTAVHRGRVRAGLLLLVSCFVLNLAAQPQANSVFSHLDLDTPGLKNVKSAVDAGDMDRAAAELLRYFQSRTNRVYDERVRSSVADSTRALFNARNIMEFKGERHDFGPKIDWSYVATDREWNYTLNRMEWFNNYVTQYERTRDERLVRAWMTQIESWMDVGNPGHPRTIDTGRRMEALVYSHYMFVTRLKSPSVDPAFHARLLASIHEQCEFLNAPEHWRRFSNWGTFETSGYADAAVMFPEFKRANTWLREIFFRMRTQMQLSFDSDGMHIEVSPSYHAHELKVWCDFVRMTELNGIANPWPAQNIQPTPRDLLRTPAMALGYVMTPDGSFPQLGDTDRREETDYMKFLSEFFNSPQLKFVATRGRDGVPPFEVSKAFPETGYFFLRSGWGSDPKTFENQMYVVFDATLNKPWHAHLDALNLLLTAHGKDLLIDPGRFTYNEGPERDQFIGSAAHNTLVINKTDQKKGEPKPEAEWRFMDSFDFVRGARTQGDVWHERSVLFVKPEYVIVIDRVAGPGRNSYDQYWHLGPEAKGRSSIADGAVLSPGLVIASSLPHNSATIGKGAVSTAYREKQEAPVARYSFSAKGEKTVVTVLFPRSNETNQVRIAAGDDAAGSTFVIDHDDVSDVVLLRQGSSVVGGRKVESDADVGFVRLSKSGSVSNRFFGLKASTIKVDGTALFDSFRRPVDVSSSGTRVTANGRNIVRLLIGTPGVAEVVVNGETTSMISKDGTLNFPNR